jgi:hypothetical protein
MLRSLLSVLRPLTPGQRNAVLPAYLGWTLDAFDFIILVFVISRKTASSLSRMCRSLFQSCGVWHATAA